MTLDEMTDGKIDYILGEIEYNRLRLRERNFMIEIREKWNDGETLTDEEKMRMGKIWEARP